MTFAERALLPLALLPALFVLCAWLWDRRQRRLLLGRLGDPALIARLTAAASPGRRALKMILVAAAATALVIAAARPQIQGTREVELRGLDIVIALDVSTSMLVSDVAATPRMEARGRPPTRLEQARELIDQQLEALPGDRVGPVVFAAAAAHFPLTEDHEVAMQFFTDLGPADLPRGSDLAEALRVSQCLLRKDLDADAGCSAAIGRRGNGGRPLAGEREPEPAAGEGAEEEELIEREERGRVMIVVTDGEESDDGSRAALREVRKARELGIATLLVGVGSEAGGPVYDIDDEGQRVRPKMGPGGEAVISRRGDAAMRALAEAAGDASRYLVAQGTDPTAITAALERVSRGLATRKTRQKRDIFHPFVLAAILLLAADAALSTRRRRRYPEAAPGEAAKR